MTRSRRTRPGPSLRWPGARPAQAAADDPRQSPARRRPRAVILGPYPWERDALRQRDGETEKKQIAREETERQLRGRATKREREREREKERDRERQK